MNLSIGMQRGIGIALRNRFAPKKNVVRTNSACQILCRMGASFICNFFDRLFTVPAGRHTYSSPPEYPFAVHFSALRAACAIKQM